jgi:hypothetical protein
MTELLTLTSLSRLTGAGTCLLTRLVRTRALIPDAVTTDSGFILFRPDRVKEIEALVSAARSAGRQRSAVGLLRNAPSIPAPTR